MKTLLVVPFRTRNEKSREERKKARKFNFPGIKRTLLYISTQCCIQQKMYTSYHVKHLTYNPPPPVYLRKMLTPNYYI